MIEAKRAANLAAKIKAGEFEMTSGVSVSSGGGNEGPNPHHLIEAALGACTVITAQMYANRKGWKLTSTDVKVTILKEGKETKMLREVVFVGELSTEERTRLAEIVDKCPIHQLLESNITIDTICS